MEASKHRIATSALVVFAGILVYRLWVKKKVIPRNRETFDEEMKVRIAYSNATTLVSMLQRGEITSAELLEIFIERIEKLDGTYNAVVVRDFDRARLAAKQADALYNRNKGRNLKPLHGLPFTVKEEMAVCGMPEACRGDPAYHKENKIEDYSIDVIKSIEEAGGIIFGKTNVPKGCLDWQCYNQVYGTTLNPYDFEVSPGGSSGGSAVALACGFTPLELGGDSAGSIRIPAAFNGVFGLAPTHGRVPTNRPGHKAVVFGPLARSVGDISLLLDVIDSKPTKQTSLDPLVELSTLTCVQWDGSTMVTGQQHHAPSPDVQACVRELGLRLLQAGVNVKEVVDDDQIETAAVSVSNHSLVQDWPLPGVSVERSLQLFHQLLAMKDVEEGEVSRRFFKEQEMLKDEWESFFQQGVDFLIMPVTISNSFLNDHNHSQNAYTENRMVCDKDYYNEYSISPASNDIGGKWRNYDCHFFWCHFSIIAHLPALTLPMGLNPVSGLPQAVQLVGRSGQDDTLLRIGELIEKNLIADLKTPPPQGCWI